ncbi:hypothetical protein BC834DRAFT_868698 [Gloeopeniophorella convolvens]|nr:hypothetical protein BC834DRAFT_868698 [Gloeopeniophorella convolvens]
MPFIRCRNFDESGSRRVSDKGFELPCHPNCDFIHPSDPGWDSARPAGSRGRGGFHSQRGRGRGGPPFRPSGSNAKPLNPSRGGSSNSWGDYVGSFGSDSAATPSGWGSSQPQNGGTSTATSGWGTAKATDERGSVENSGWGNEGTDGGWGTSASSSGWGAADASSSGWGASTSKAADSTAGWPDDSPSGVKPPATSWTASSTTGWGSSTERDGVGDGWGSHEAATGSGWGHDSRDNGSNTAPTAAPLMHAGATTADIPSKGDEPKPKPPNEMQPSLSLEPPSHTGPSGRPDDHRDVLSSPTVVASPLPIESEPSSETLAIYRPATDLVPKSQMQAKPDDDGRPVIVTSWDSHNGVSDLVLYVVATQRLRGVEGQSLRWETLRKSRQFAMSKAAKNAVQHKYQGFVNARLALEAEQETRSLRFAQIDSIGFPLTTLTSASQVDDSQHVDQYAVWLVRAGDFLSSAPPPKKPVEIEAGSSVSPTLSQLKQIESKIYSLPDISQTGQDISYYEGLIDQKLQEKRGILVAASGRNQEGAQDQTIKHHLSLLQSQETSWGQKLQTQAEGLAQALSDIKQVESYSSQRSSLQESKKGPLQQLQARIVQRQSQLESLHRDLAQLTQTFETLKKQQEEPTTLVSSIEPHIKAYVQDITRPQLTAASDSLILKLKPMQLKVPSNTLKVLQASMQMAELILSLDTPLNEDLEMAAIDQSL